MGVDHVPVAVPDPGNQDAGAQVERETGFEPATPSLEGWRSTAELFPRSLSTRRFSPAKVVGRGGFEPPKAFASRFTVCPLWPLGYLPAGSSDCNPLKCLALAGGFEPPTHCLQGSCSAPGLRQQSQNFTLVSRPSQVKTFLLRTFHQASECPPLTPAGAALRSRGRLPRRRRSATRSSLS